MEESLGAIGKELNKMKGREGESKREQNMTEEKIQMVEKKLEERVGGVEGNEWMTGMRRGLGNWRKRGSVV